MDSIIDKTAIQNVIKQYTGVDDADEARNKLLSRGLFSKARESAEETRGQVKSAVSQTVEDALASVAGLTNLTISKRSVAEDPETPDLPEDQPGELFDDPAMRTFEGDLYELKIEKPTEEAQGKNAGTTVSYPRGGSGKEIDLSNYTDNFAGVYLKYHEGTKDHKSHEDDTITKAYGVKYPRGLEREDYDSDQEFAAAVALKHRNAAIKKFDDVGADWDALPQSVKYAIVDLHYNVGRIGSTASKDTQEGMLKNTLEYVLMTSEKENTKGTLISLAKRRAWNWNKATADTGLEKITRIEQIPTGRGTTFKYYDKNDNVIHEVNNKSTKPYKVLNNGDLQLLTQTREVTL